MAAIRDCAGDPRIPNPCKEPDPAEESLDLAEFA
jgi:hypothetical protein